ncbi:RidA family protein [Streptosporangium carneum]|uniref:Uncharacterized protein n=1 Tax=Streptosporangium carneum TaxID=47481 RepID=A0A9W6MHR8_9ACTN|nr:RidA family protein [Streptosporangium carneum]GLK14233.1 hypothetical protein GCM10017600_76450 [Streptosporangium carneum]
MRADLAGLVRLHLRLRDVADLGAARKVFAEFFEPGGFPARMTLTTTSSTLGAWSGSTVSPVRCEH